MEERYYEWMAAAYLRGAAAAKDISVPDETAVLFAGKWEEMTGEDVKNFFLRGRVWEFAFTILNAPPESCPG